MDASEDYTPNDITDAAWPSDHTDLREQLQRMENFIADLRSAVGGGMSSSSSYSPRIQ